MDSGVSRIRVLGGATSPIAALGVPLGALEATPEAAAAIELVPSERAASVAATIWTRRVLG